MSAEVIDLISSDEDEDINNDIEFNDMEKNSNNNNFNNKNNSSTFTNGSSKTIEIKVRRSDNASDIIMNISPYETCGTLKKRIFEKEMIDPERQRIMFAGKEIRNNSTLKDYTKERNEKRRTETRRFLCVAYPRYQSLLQAQGKLAEDGSTTSTEEQVKETF